MVYHLIRKFLQNILCIAILIIPVLYPYANTYGQDLQKYVIADTLGEIYDFHVADLDDDGISEILTIDVLDDDPDDPFNHTEFRVILWIWSEESIFEGNIFLNDFSPMNSRKVGFSATDFDSDGDTDILLTAGTEEESAITLMDNQGDLDFEPVIISTDMRSGSDVFAGDIDNDGDNDVLTAAKRMNFHHDFEGGISWFENDNGEFEKHDIVPYDWENMRNGWATGYDITPMVDIDHDDDLDFFTTSGKFAGARRTGWWENDGEGEFSFNALPLHGVGLHIVAEDMNDDGYVDLVQTAHDYDWMGVSWDKGVYININVEGDSFNTWQVDSTRMDEYRDLGVADFNLDGFQDIVLMGAFEVYGFEILIDDWEFNYDPHRYDLGDYPPLKLETGDMDGDSDTDVVIAERAWSEDRGNYGILSWWENDHFNSVDPELILHPSGFILFPAYPNPFNSSTVISYSLDEAANVELRVLDIGGRLIDTVVSRFSDAGNYRVSFDGSRLASGSYIVELKSGDRIQIEKMVLVR